MRHIRLPTTPFFPCLLNNTHIYTPFKIEAISLTLHPAIHPMYQSWPPHGIERLWHRRRDRQTRCRARLQPPGPRDRWIRGDSRLIKLDSQCRQGEWQTRYNVLTPQLIDENTTRALHHQLQPEDNITQPRYQILLPREQLHPARGYFSDIL